MDEITTTIGSLSSLGTVLRKQRNARGWSLPAAANHVGVPAVVLGSYERGQRNPSLSKLVQILSAYGLRLAVVDDTDVAKARIAALRGELAKLEVATRDPAW